MKAAFLVFFSAFTALTVASGFELEILQNKGKVSLHWNAQVGHQYQILSGSNLSAITTPKGNPVTAVTAQPIIPIRPEANLEFFRVQDHGWRARMLTIGEESSGQVVVRWSTQLNSLYQIDRVEEISGGWSSLQSNLAASPPANSFTDATAANLAQGFYRVQVWTNGTWQLMNENLAGFQRLTVYPDLNLFRMDFEPLDGLPWTPERVLGNQWPAGTRCWVSRADLEGTNIVETFDGTEWSPNTHQFPRGSSFWLENITPSSATLFLSGAMPDAKTGPTTTVEIRAGFTGCGYAYPLEKMWTETTLAQNATIGDTLKVWDAVLQNFNDFSLTPRNGWRAASSWLIQPGMGFYFQTSFPQTWEEIKPYSYP